MNSGFGSVDALLVNPPLLKYDAGPPAGFVSLIAASRLAGLRVAAFDANALFLARQRPAKPPAQEGPIGDHARPNGSLGHLKPAFYKDMGLVGAPETWHYAWFGESELDDLMAQPDPLELGKLLNRIDEDRPAIVGFSVLVAPQLLWTLLACRRIRQRFPETRLVLGGAYPSAMRLQQSPDLARIWLAHADLIVMGKAEGRWKELVRQSRSAEFPRGILQGDEVWLPARMSGVDDLFAGYRCPEPMVPLQTSIGCPYGKCDFCSYPLVEPQVARIDDDDDYTAHVRAGVETAARLGGALVIKDSLVMPREIGRLCRVIAGRVPFAICTSVDALDNVGCLIEAQRAGLHTIELGVEVTDEDLLRRAGKRRRKGALERVLTAASQAGIYLVLNIIMGLVDQTEEQAWAEFHYLLEELPELYPDLRYSLEVNALEIERGTPLARRFPKLQWGPYAMAAEREVSPWVMELVRVAR